MHTSMQRSLTELWPAQEHTCICTQCCVVSYKPYKAIIFNPQAVTYVWTVITVQGYWFFNQLAGTLLEAERFPCPLTYKSRTSSMTLYHNTTPVATHWP